GEAVSFFVGQVAQSDRQAQVLATYPDSETGIEIVPLQLAKFRPDAQTRPADIVRPALGGEFELALNRSPVIEAYPAGEPGDIRDLSDVFEQLRRQILQTSRKTRNIECQCNAFEKKRRRFVDAAVVVSEARIEPEVGRDGDTRGERGRPYPSIADIG